MIVVLLIAHGLLAVTLLGAITHQALSLVPRRVAAAAFVSAAIAWVVPLSLAERLRPSWAWIVPLVIAVLMLVYERRWFM